MCSATPACAGVTAGGRSFACAADPAMPAAAAPAGWLLATGDGGSATGHGLSASAARPAVSDSAAGGTGVGSAGGMREPRLLPLPSRRLVAGVPEVLPSLAAATLLHEAAASVTAAQQCSWRVAACSAATDPAADMGAATARARARRCPAPCTCHCPSSGCVLQLAVAALAGRAAAGWAESRRARARRLAVAVMPGVTASNNGVPVDP